MHIFIINIILSSNQNEQIIYSMSWKEFFSELFKTLISFPMVLLILLILIALNYKKILTSIQETIRSIKAGSFQIEMRDIIKEEQEIIEKVNEKDNSIEQEQSPKQKNNEKTSDFEREQNKETVSETISSVIYEKYLENALGNNEIIIENYKNNKNLQGPIEIVIESWSNLVRRLGEYFSFDEVEKSYESRIVNLTMSLDTYLNVKLVNLRRIRNSIVHAVATIDTENAILYYKECEKVLNYVKDKYPPDQFSNIEIKTKPFVKE